MEQFGLKERRGDGFFDSHSNQYFCQSPWCWGSLHIIQFSRTLMWKSSWLWEKHVVSQGFCCIQFHVELHSTRHFIMCRGFTIARCLHCLLLAHTKLTAFSGCKCSWLITWVMLPNVFPSYKRWHDLLMLITPLLALMQVWPPSLPLSYKARMCILVFAIIFHLTTSWKLVFVKEGLYIKFKFDYLSSVFWIFCVHLGCLLKLLGAWWCPSNIQILIKLLDCITFTILVDLNVDLKAKLFYLHFWE